MNVTDSLSSAQRTGRPTRSTNIAKQRHHFRTVVAALDVVVIVVAIVIAVLLRFGENTDAAQVGTASGPLGYTFFSACLAIAWVIALHAKQCYRVELFGVGDDEFRRVARATFGLFGAIAIVALLAKLDLARGYLAIAFPLGLLLLLLERAIVRRWIVRRRAHGDYCDQTLIIGTPPEVRRAASVIARHPAAGYRAALVSVIGTDESPFVLSDGTEVDNVGPIADVSTLDGSINTLIVAGQSAMTPEEVRQIGWQLEGTDIRLALTSTMTDVAGPRIHRRPIEGLPLMSVESPTYAGRKFLVKRMLDIAISVVVLVLLSPVLVVLAACVYFEDRGPVLFRQVRVGVNGQLFRMTKFRSMVVDAEKLRADLVPDDASGVLFKMKDDPRITRVGKFIRTYSLDELPQLFDVLIGHMSLVGPRPPLPDEVRRYEKHVHRRLNVKPGVTGPWQVGGRSKLTWAQSVQKDLYYVENWSVTGDLAILARTVRAVLQREGAH
ncbi:polyprenyl glycosylphosphotransferase [Flexivirga endophytica]|uniref:Polyprenyl glycosylphosphotransferase n=1 Tax=Flexivirga endophytica TaxID=1849103 RepID=A0A916SUX3_9MICO|nr:sugar transferase [Flexivirga endophytica]GGB15157.1 polyprenyl glycosylphosphotransferase [Flexivirga endophytica]GHB65103.1 polyprenyl glycosylphosphotransferase [Flexivirga endophytica]